MSPSVLRGPDFGTYAPDEVGWLLKDLSDVPLERPTQEREAEIQQGRAHYSDSLPIEYRPGPEYEELYRETLARTARRVAHDVGIVAELIRDERGPRPVLVSLARAGTPIGVLLRRWFAFTGAPVPDHYALSIIRGRGIDTVALNHLAATYPPSSVVFVDGWTGKGAIARELAAAIAAHNDHQGTDFSPELSVLADPGGSVTRFSSRDDYLVPSAALNSTVSGLVSRTVLNARLIGPADFHGAKFYSDLRPFDVSQAFLDAVSREFASVAADVSRKIKSVAASDRRETWIGERAAQGLADRLTEGDLNRVKPGIGETTRVLLRRMPQLLLLRHGAHPDTRHIALLAEERRVPIEVVPDLPFACVGIIRGRSGAA